MKANLHTFATLEQLAQAAAGYVAQLSAQATAERGRFTVALSGGSLPKILCPPLAAEPLRGQVDWSSWRVFWADERCVPLTDPDSNYRLAREYLFEQVDIPPGQIYPLDDTLNPAAAARAYQAKLAEVLQPPAGQRPRFDLILLGMGEDGHTASLFPHHPLLRETERWVAPIFDSPKPPPERITLTLPVINKARQVAFITAGAGKAGALAQVMKAEAINPLPAQMVQPVKGELHWFVDEAAATSLAG
jgi:6-phosphogluconolactonase